MSIPPDGSIATSRPPQRRVWIVLALLALCLQGLSLAHPLVAEAAVRTFYVNCSTGADANAGTSPTTAWKSLSKANGAALLPGDSLLLARGCTWQGSLKAKWNGTAAAPILISAYGSGDLPKIQNGPTDLADGAHNDVDVTGSYQIIEYLQVTIVNPPVEPGCGNNPIGFFVGFNFRNPDNTANGGSFNILRYSNANHAMAGVHFNNNTHDDKILNNTLTDNNVMMILTPKAVKANDDLGAWGVLLKGRNQEVAYNYLARNNALCTYDTAPQGNSIEVYEAQNSIIHHNTAVGDRVFSELGGSTAMRADGITYAYNLVISAVNDARFVTLHGANNTFGPTDHTTVLNNTVYFTGAASQTIVCGAGCTLSMLTARNNILWAEQKAAYADAAFTESNNLYWNTAGTPFVQFQNFTMSPTSKLANPQFANAAAGDFHLQTGSPAINAGVLVGWNVDLGGLAVPFSLLPDLGSYESNLP